MRGSLRRFCLIAVACLPLSAWAGTAVPFTINLSKPVNVVTSGGTPRIAVDVAGTTRYANYTSGSGTSALVFTYNMQAGDVDLDGVAVSSPVQLNGGTIKDLSGNPLTNLTFTPPNTAGVKVNYPSLGMDFTNGAGGRYTLNGTPYTTLASFLTAAGGSFTRASVGTYYDSAGVLQTASANTPRLDYDPVTHAAKGILIEEARTNLATYSQQINDGSWHTYGSPPIVTDAAMAPDGTMSAESVALTAGSQQHVYKFQTTTSPNATYTGSVWMRAASGNVKLKIWQTNAVAWSTAVVSNEITLDTNWQRYNVVRTAGASDTKTDFGFGYEGKTGYNIPLSGTIYIWGAQLEQGAFPTSYIPTTTATVTRAADVLTVPTTSGGWYSASAGTLTTQATMPYVGGTSYPRTASLSDGSLQNDILLLVDDLNADVKKAEINTGGVIQMLSSSSAYVAGNLLKQGIAYSLNNSIVANDGALGSLDTTVTIPTVSTLAVGSHSPSVPRYLNGNIQKLKYYPARVPNAQLQRMTQ